MSGFEILRRRLLCFRGASPASFCGVFAVRPGPRCRPCARALFAGIAEVVVGVVGGAVPFVVVVSPVEVVVVVTGTVVVAVLVDVDVDETVVVGASVVVSVVVGSASAEAAAATPIAKSSAAPKPAITFSSGIGRIMEADPLRDCAALSRRFGTTVDVLRNTYIRDDLDEDDLAER